MTNDKMEWCPQCGKLIIQPNVNYGISPDAVCGCTNAGLVNRIDVFTPVPAAAPSDGLEGRIEQELFRGWCPHSRIRHLQKWDCKICVADFVRSELARVQPKETRG